MSRGETDMVNLVGTLSTEEARLLMRILAHELNKAVILDTVEKRSESFGTTLRRNLLSFMRSALIKAGRVDVWNAAFENPEKPESFIHVIT